jgi:TolA-binding protein
MDSSRSSSFIPLSLLINLLASAALIGCASTASKPTPKTEPPFTASSAEPKTEELSQAEQMQRLREKISDLETRIGALNEKINLSEGGATKEIARDSVAEPATRDAPAKKSARTSMLLDGEELPTEMVKAPAAHAKVIPTSKTPAKFVADENVDRYREAKIQYDAGRFSDATVEFVSFTKEAPDHPLAPAAQYFVGMGYLKQKEYGRAEEELNRGLVSYPHSSYVPDTLLALLEISMATQKKGRVTYYQQKISSTFPNSPQALKAALLINRPATDVVSRETEPQPSLVTRPQVPDAPEAPTTPKTGEGESQ